jgi:alpha/beta hydrolase family protein
MFSSAAVILALLAFGQAASWRDPSPHQVRFITVDSTIKLEVLDWGGSGRPVLWIGCYLTAHVYDNIAPKLTDQFHVYAVTRRGIGASDHPSTGYSPQRRADDILEVIGALKMERPILVGNSCGGWQADLRAGVPTAKIVELPGASLYMFLSNESDIVGELRAFGAKVAK